MQMSLFQCLKKPRISQAMVAKFSSLSTRKLSSALTLLSCNKAMVATSDYGDFHKMVKRHHITGLLGANAQANPLDGVNFGEPLKNELFSLALKQALGKDIDSIYVEEHGRELSKKELFDVLVVEPMKGAIEVDWRDYFPYLRWVPNRSMKMKIQRVVKCSRAVTKALIMEQRKCIALRKEINRYLDFVLTEEHTLTEEQLIMLVWEAIIGSSDSTSAAIEWAMYQLAKDFKCQYRLYREILDVCGTKKLTEEHLPRLPYLHVVFHGTLRRYSPVPLVPFRYAHEDTQLGGYGIQGGSLIAINIYGCNMNNKEWDNPEEWKPERFLSSKYEVMDLYKTMAFGGGRRVCTVSLQVMLISCTTIGRLVQDFEWMLKEGEEEKINAGQFTTHKFQPLLAYIMPRKSYI